MRVPSFGKVHESPSSPSAFIFYRSKSKTLKEMLFCNEEAFRILSLHFCSPGDQPAFPDISALCLKWKGLLDKSLDGAGGHSKGTNPETGFIDIIKSHRRKYAVRGILLSEQVSVSEGQKQYLFILERTTPEKMNLSMIFRNLGLNKREQEIVHLLLAGSANKEIADSLGLSLNTIKGYMKLLTRKLGVNNRAGIIAAILGSNVKETK